MREGTSQKQEEENGGGRSRVSPLLWSPILTALTALSPGIYLRGGRWLGATLTTNPIVDFHARYVSALFWGSAIWFVSMVAAMGVLVWGLQNRSHAYRISGAIPMFVGCIGFLTFPFIFDCQRNEAIAVPKIIENAGPLVRALERYKADYGTYPQQLGLLVPAYLPQIPRPGILGEATFDYRYPASWPAGFPNMYQLKVHFGIEDSFYYLSDEKARAQLLSEPGVLQAKEQGWIFEDT